MQKPVVVLVGRPNVGKSTLFNRLIGERLAIIDDIPGTTRDRLVAEGNWAGYDFFVVDTGGIDPSKQRTQEPLSIGSKEFIRDIREQAEIAMAEADVILLMVDAQQGVTQADLELVDILRRRQVSSDGTDPTPVLLVANKAESKSAWLGSMDFYSLGLGEPYAISAIHGTGTGDLLDAVVAHFPHAIDDDTADESIKVAIVGKPNVGKSSLLNIMAGLDHEYQGQAVVDGKAITGPSAERLLLFQEPALFPWMNIAENVAFGLAARGLPRCERIPVVDRYLAMVHLEAFAHAHPHELSGGMRQRAALARALAVDPDLLLMDEPFAALDAQTRDMLHGELQEVWTTTGKTIVFVTHNVREALILGDRVLLMSARPGKIKKEFVFDLPRPRHFEDPGIAEAARVV
ncbi:MAG TPA: 50S ribosome-binding GTPase, partial [Anaerolineaceae bacterium]|nr:50S ribosome-binding GTPase [Anaerolineaceae bacterium]